VVKIHQDCVNAGADIISAATFRTQPRCFRVSWRALLNPDVGSADKTGGPNVLVNNSDPVTSCGSFLAGRIILNYSLVKYIFVLYLQSNNAL